MMSSCNKCLFHILFIYAYIHVCMYLCVSDWRHMQRKECCVKGLSHYLVQGCLPYAASKRWAHVDNKNIFFLYEIFYVTTVNTCIKSLNVTVLDIILHLECWNLFLSFAFESWKTSFHYRTGNNPHFLLQHSQMNTIKGGGGNLVFSVAFNFNKTTFS